MNIGVRMGLLGILAVSFVPCAAETWGEKLGFPADQKVIILHADDIGMSYEGNIAAKDSLPKKHYLSCSAMAPCPWFNEFANWAKENPGYDIGLHVTLNAEWKWYRWAPVSDPSDVPGLVDKEGYLHNSTVVSAIRGKGAEVEKEIRAQVEKALALGFRPTHLDSHMGTCFAKPEFVEAYLKVALEYGIPAFVPAPSPALIARLRQEGTPITAQHVKLMEEHPGPKIDDFYVLGNAADYEQKKAQTLTIIESIEPGLTQIIFHPSVESETMKNITGTWQMRSWEARMWGDPDIVQYFKDNNIVQTNWIELEKRYQERFGKSAAAN